MNRNERPFKNLGDLIDHVEKIREELLSIQRALEKLENIDSDPMPEASKL